MIIRASLVAAFALLPLPALVQPAAAAPGSASPADCKIIAGVMATKIAAADHPPLNAESFGGTCDWKAVGAAVPMRSGSMGWRSFFAPPAYGDDGLKVQVQFSENNRGPNYYSFHNFDCALERKDQTQPWQIAHCQRSVVTGR